MKLKNSNSMRRFAFVFFFVAVLSFVGGIIGLAARVTDIQNIIIWFISGALWTTCGIILLINAKLKKIEEDKKEKISAFNYGKKKLHKKAKK